MQNNTAITSTFLTVHVCCQLMTVSTECSAFYCMHNIGRNWVIANASTNVNIWILIGVDTPNSKIYKAIDHAVYYLCLLCSTENISAGCTHLVAVLRSHTRKQTDTPANRQTDQQAD
ncbi:hypothetical protein BsWGS_23554 [Bradybaena similaris]